jgi:hypothetical protein
LAAVAVAVAAAAAVAPAQGVDIAAGVAVDVAVVVGEAVAAVGADFVGTTATGLVAAARTEPAVSLVVVVAAAVIALAVAKGRIHWTTIFAYLASVAALAVPVVAVVILEEETEWLASVLESWVPPARLAALEKVPQQHLENTLVIAAAVPAAVAVAVAVTHKLDTEQLLVA